MDHKLKMEAVVDITELYKLLGLEIDALPADIKLRYRKLALTCHPDRYPDCERTADQFRALTSAYRQVLKHAERQEVKAESLRVPLAAHPEEEDQLSQSRQTVANVATDTHRLPRESQPRTRRIVHPVEISLTQVFSGASLRVRLRGGSNVKIDIPRGVEDGDVIHHEASNSCIDLQITVRKHRRYQRRGADLYYHAGIPQDAAFRGVILHLNTPCGRLDVGIPARSVYGNVFRQVRKGLPSPSGRGDLYVHIEAPSPSLETSFTERKRSSRSGARP